MKNGIYSFCLVVVACEDRLESEPVFLAILRPSVYRNTNIDCKNYASKGSEQNSGQMLSRNFAFPIAFCGPCRQLAYLLGPIRLLCALLVCIIHRLISRASPSVSVSWSEINICRFDSKDELFVGIVPSRSNNC